MRTAARLEALMGNVPRLEMFARTRTPGWDVWGNEVRGSLDIPLRQPSGQAAGVDGESERRWRRCSTAS